MVLALDDIATAEIIKEIVSKLKEAILETRKEPQLVEVLIKPNSFQYSEIKSVTTVLTTKPEEANLEFTNPLDAKCKVKEISYIPDTSFKAKGILLITINDVPVLRTGTQQVPAASLTNVSEDSIKFTEGKTINPTDKVKIYAWTTDATSSILSVKVTFGD